MGQELLDRVGYVKTPRKFFVATNAQGYKTVRGSADKDYAWCVISKDFTQWGYLYASWSATEHNAKKYCKTWNNKAGEELYEVVKCEQVTSKEARLIKKQMQLAWLEIQQRVSEGTKEDKENN